MREYDHNIACVLAQWCIRVGVRAARERERGSSQGRADFGARTGSNQSSGSLFEGHVLRSLLTICIGYSRENADAFVVLCSSGAFNDRIL